MLLKVFTRVGVQLETVVVVQMRFKTCISHYSMDSAQKIGCVDDGGV